MVLVILCLGALLGLWKNLPSPPQNPTKLFKMAPRWALGDGIDKTDKMIKNKFTNEMKILANQKWYDLGFDTSLFFFEHKLTDTLMQYKHPNQTPSLS